MHTNIALPLFPAGRVMRDEVSSDGVEAVFCGEDVIFPLQLSFEPLGNVDIRKLCLKLLQLFSNSFIELGMLQAELFTTGVVEKRNRCAILDRTLETVSRRVTAIDAPRDLIVLHERRAGEADEIRVGERLPHVQRQIAILRPVRLVSHDDDIGAIGIE